MLQAKYVPRHAKWIDRLENHVVGDFRRVARPRVHRYAKHIMNEAKGDTPEFTGRTAGAFRTESIKSTSEAVFGYEVVNRLRQPAYESKHGPRPFNIALGAEEGVKEHYVSVIHPGTMQVRHRLLAWARKTRFRDRINRELKRHRARPWERHKLPTVKVHSQSPEQGHRMLTKRVRDAWIDMTVSLNNAIYAFVKKYR